MTALPLLPPRGVPPRMTTIERTLAAFVLAIAVSGCAAAGPTSGPSGPGPSGAPSATPTPTATTTDGQATSDPIAHPTGAADVVLRVETGGGFVPDEIRLQEFPSITLYGDGTLIQVTQEAYDQALPDLVRYHLTPAAIQTVLQRADELGLIGNDLSYGFIEVTDLGSTALSITAADSHTLHAAYGLYFDITDGLTAEEAAAREVFRGFLGQLADVEAWVGQEVSGGDPYTPERLEVFVEPAADAELQLDGTPVAWPLPGFATAVAAGQPEFGFACLVIEGADVATLLPVLEGTDVTTAWTADGATYLVVARPVLAHEAPCADD